MQLLIDHRIYSDPCISKAIYSLSDLYSFNRKVIDDYLEQLTIIPANGHQEEADMQRVFLTRLNDYKLRQIIEDETHDIRTILYVKAFADFEEI